MTTAIYVHNGCPQIVLTAENDFERAVLKYLDGGKYESRAGSFYQCNGGYARHGGQSDSSVILCKIEI